MFLKKNLGFEKKNFSFLWILNLKIKFFYWKLKNKINSSNIRKTKKDENFLFLNFEPKKILFTKKLKNKDNQKYPINKNLKSLNF